MRGELAAVAFSSYGDVIDLLAKKAKNPVDAVRAYFPSLFNKEGLTTSTNVAGADAQALLDAILSISKRLALGVETELSIDDRYLSSLFESIQLSENSSNPQGVWHYPLKPLSVESIFPQKRQEALNALSYTDVWECLANGVKNIPQAHTKDSVLWLDHFDTLWQHCAHNIPVASQKDIALYDYVKTVSALSVALWGWAKDQLSFHNAELSSVISAITNNIQDKKLLLIQGDFFGIQNFIFANGSQSNKQAAKLLRGRSFQVSLFAEVAALKVLEACGLPSTSQILNAAGKFMIVAPNTPTVRAKLQQVREEINQWFLAHSFGLLGLGLATQEASAEDFLDKNKFTALIKQSFSVLEKSKLQRFNLTVSSSCVLDADYQHGVCGYNQFLPAEVQDKNGIWVAKISADQIKMGSLLTKYNRIMVLKSADSVRTDADTQVLSLDIFGYYIAFTQEQLVTGKFGNLVANGLVRCWDFSLPNQDKPLWQGYARRYVNAYVPHFSYEDMADVAKYQVLTETADVDEMETNQIKTFHHLACEDRQKNSAATADKYLGKVAIATLKGDVDNLGKIFEKGLAEPNFARMAGLSRQMNLFFSLWLPYCCATQFPNIYTVFAGGDDFFMIGPWRTTQKFAYKMREAFQQYVADNPDITFSAGISVTKPDVPVHKLSAYAEDALESAKTYQHDYGVKNSVNVYDINVAWQDWSVLEKAYDQILDLKKMYDLSTSYLYGMLQLSESAEKAEQGYIEHSLWRSRFAYRTKRFVEGQKSISKDQKQDAYMDLLRVFSEQGIQQFGKQYHIPLFNHFYLLRAR